MVEEGEWHRRTRTMVMRILESGNLAFLHDHGEGGRPLRLYKTDDTGKVHLSEADILVFGDDGRVMHIIEVMGGNTTPKSMIGIAGATALCDAFIDSEGKKHDLRKPTLWIVLDQGRVRDKGPNKHTRMMCILKELQDDEKPLVRFDNIAGVRICYADTFEREFIT